MAQQQHRPMTLRGFMNNFKQVVDQTKVNMAMKLANGSTVNMAQYNRQVGRMEGLDQAVGLFKDMLGQIEDIEKQEQLPEMTGTGDD